MDDYCLTITYFVFRNVNMGFTAPDVPQPNSMYCTSPRNENDVRRGRDRVGIGQKEPLGSQTEVSITTDILGNC